MINLLFPNDNWSRVEIFQVAHERLPMTARDVITRNTLKLFQVKVHVMGRKATQYQRMLAAEIGKGTVLTSKQIMAAMSKGNE